MQRNQEEAPFPEQQGPGKIAGEENAPKMRERYIRDAGKIEDIGDDSLATHKKSGDPADSQHLTDNSGEEKKEDYINTDERQEDLKQRGL